MTFEGYNTLHWFWYYRQPTTLPMYVVPASFLHLHNDDVDAPFEFAPRLMNTKGSIATTSLLPLLRARDRASAVAVAAQTKRTLHSSRGACLGRRRRYSICFQSLPMRLYFLFHIEIMRGVANLGLILAALGQTAQGSWRNSTQNT
jgi:hypothetical protein